MSELVRIVPLILSLLLVADGQPTSEKQSKPSAVAAETFLLRYQIRDGEQLRYESTQTLLQKTVVGEQQKEEIATTLQLRRFSVDEFSDDTADAKLQFERVRQSLQVNGGEEIVADSNMPVEEIPGVFRSAFRKLNQAASKVRVSRAGTKIDKERVELSEYASFMIPLPKQPVMVGDSWTSRLNVKVRISLGVVADIKLLRSFRLKSVDDGIATIALANSYLTPVKSTKVKAQLIHMAKTGIIKFDIQRGQLLQKKLKIDNAVIGYLGPNTLATATGQSVETLLDSSETVPIQNRVVSEK